MLELFGSGYVLDYCVVQLQQEQKERSYKRYISEVLRLMGENVAKAIGGSYYASRWDDRPQPEDDRTGDEVAMDIINRAGLRVKGSE